MTSSARGGPAQPFMILKQEHDDGSQRGGKAGRGQTGRSCAKGDFGGILKKGTSIGAPKRQCTSVDVR